MFCRNTCIYGYKSWYYSRISTIKKIWEYLRISVVYDKLHQRIFVTTATNSEFYKMRLNFTLLNVYKLVKNDFLQRMKLFMTRIFFTFNASENKALVTCITQMRWVVRFTQLRVRRLIQRHAVWYKVLKVSEESAASSFMVEEWENILLSSWTDFSATAPNRAIFCLSADSHCSLIDHTHLYSNVLGLYMNRIFHRSNKFYPFGQVKERSVSRFLCYCDYFR
jgi:hypothetical protein